MLQVCLLLASASDASASASDLIRHETSRVEGSGNFSGRTKAKVWSKQLLPAWFNEGLAGKSSRRFG